MCDGLMFQWLSCIIGLHTNIARHITENRQRIRSERSSTATASNEDEASKDEAMDTATTDSSLALPPSGKPTASVAPTLKQSSESATTMTTDNAQDVEIIAAESVKPMEIDLTDSEPTELNGVKSDKDNNAVIAANGDVVSDSGHDTESAQSSQLRNKLGVTSQGNKGTVSALSPRISSVKPGTTQVLGKLQ
jgi:hypothetical protein